MYPGSCHVEQSPSNRWNIHRNSARQRTHHRRSHIHRHTTIRARTTHQPHHPTHTLHRLNALAHSRVKPLAQGGDGGDGWAQVTVSSPSFPSRGELVSFVAPVRAKIPRHFSICTQITLDDSNLRGFFAAGAAGVAVVFQKNVGPLFCSCMPPYLFACSCVNFHAWFCVC